MNHFRYKTLLFDADDTILDFKATASDALYNLFTKYGISTDELTLSIYHKINHNLWSAFERNEVTREEILYKRFEILADKLSLSIDSHAMDYDYQIELQKGHKVIQDAHQVLQLLSKSHKLYVVTNGVLKTQQIRLADANLTPYFKDIFISEAVGYQKPQIEFFDYVFDHISNVSRDDVLIIGDSLSSDILGGNNAGISTCWFNPSKAINTTSALVTHEITALKDLLNVVSCENIITLGN